MTKPPSTCQRCGQLPVDFKVAFEGGTETDDETGRPIRIHGVEYLCGQCAKTATNDADYLGATGV